MSTFAKEQEKGSWVGLLVFAASFSQLANAIPKNSCTDIFGLILLNYTT